MFSYLTGSLRIGQVLVSVRLNFKKSLRLLRLLGLTFSRGLHEGGLAVDQLPVPATRGVQVVQIGNCRQHVLAARHTTRYGVVSHHSDGDVLI